MDRQTSGAVAGGDSSLTDYRLIFESAPSLFMVLRPESPSFTIVGATDAYLAATKKQRDDLIGKALFEAFPANPDDPEGDDGQIKLLASLERVLANRAADTMSVQQYDIPLPASEGGGFEQRFWSCVNSPMFSAPGVIAAIIHRVEDVTEVVRLSNAGEKMQMEMLLRSRDLGAAKDTAEQAVAKLETSNRELARARDAAESAIAELRDYQRMVASVQDYAILMLRADGRVATWNLGAERIKGYTVQEAVGLDFHQFYPDADRLSGKPELLLATARVTGMAHDEGLRVRKDGSQFWAAVTITALRNEQGELVGYGKVTRDLTERRQQEQRLGIAKDNAEQAALAKNVFLATMSHEIRTPMNAIIGMSGLLADTPLNDEQREYAATIRTSGDHLLTVINDILDYSSLESGQIDLENIPFSVSAVVEEALDLVATKAREKHLELAYELDGDVPAMALGDPGRLRQVLLNYLSNAVKFTASGEVAVSVTAEAVGAGQRRLRFAVRDTGIGIAADKQHRLFQSFSQVDASTQRKFGGTGLGLVISKRLAEAMGGEVWVESAEGRGATFGMSILTGVHEESARVKYQEGRESPLAGLRVWVVDDNDTNRRIFRKQCETWGMVVRDTAQPEEALRWARQGDPADLVLLDYHMPGMNGVELARELHLLRGDKLKMLLVGSLETLPAEEARRLGLSGQMQKPVKHSALFNAIAKLFDRKLQASAAAGKGPALSADMAQQNPLRILVAEDNAVNVKLITIILGRLGYRPDVAGNGKEAIEALRRQPYDLILMDVQMPEMDGIEATRAICAEWKNGHRPRIVALTAGVMKEEKEQCLNAGMDEFLNKPVVPAELVAALERCKRLKPDSHPAVAPVPADVAGFDPQALAQLMHDYRAADVKELIDAFLSDSARQLDDMRSALAKQDAAALGRAVHSVKAPCEMVGAIGMSEACAELERLARSGDLSLALKKFAELEAYHRVTDAALRKSGI